MTLIEKLDAVPQEIQVKRIEVLQCCTPVIDYLKISAALKKNLPGLEEARRAMIEFFEPKIDCRTLSQVDREILRFVIQLPYEAGPDGSIGELASDNGPGRGWGTWEAVPDSGFRFAQWSDGSTVNPRTD